MSREQKKSKKKSPSVQTRNIIYPNGFAYECDKSLAEPIQYQKFARGAKIGFAERKYAEPVRLAYETDESRRRRTAVGRRVAVPPSSLCGIRYLTGINGDKSSSNIIIIRNATGVWIYVMRTLSFQGSDCTRRLSKVNVTEIQRERKRKQNTVSFGPKSPDGFYIFFFLYLISARHIIYVRHLTIYKYFLLANAYQIRYCYLNKNTYSTRRV